MPTALTTRRMWNCWPGKAWFLCHPRAMRYNCQDHRQYHTIPDNTIQYPPFLCFVSGVQKTYQVVLIAGEAQLPGSHRGFEVLGLHDAMWLCCLRTISAFQVNSVLHWRQGYRHGNWSQEIFNSIFIACP